MQVSGIGSGYGYGYAAGISAKQGPPAAKAFSEVDTDGDGAISKTELASLVPQNASGASDTSAVDDAKVSSLFKKIDSDGDGKISASEWMAFQQNIQKTHHRQQHVDLEKEFSDVDTDGDGSISKTEFAGLLQKNTSGAADAKTSGLFRKIDTDGSGGISSSEWATFQQNIQKMGPPPMDAGTDESQLAGANPEIDTNGDGQISAAEWAAYQQKIQSQFGMDQQAANAIASSGQSSSAFTNLVSKMYKAGDTDGDGQMSQNEMTAWLQSLNAGPLNQVA